MISKYDFIHILMSLRDKMKDKADSDIIHHTITDLIELDHQVVKEKYNLD
ncbi:MAG: hypothetical protein ACTSQE_16565 [Candidatus Heimdallarchaeaceae archaeon]